MRLLAAALAALVLAACTDRSTSGLVPMKAGDPMTVPATVSRPSVPPIDLAPPARIETATFALG